MYMPIKRQGIIWTNADPVHRRIYAALGGDELTPNMGQTIITKDDRDHTHTQRNVFHTDGKLRNASYHADNFSHRWVAKQETGIWQGHLHWRTVGGVSQHEHIMTCKLFLYYWSFVRWMNRSPVDSLHKWYVMRSFDIYFDISLIKLFNKQSSCRRFQMPGRSCVITEIYLICYIFIGSYN